jgi:hypothetical protein
MGKRRTVIIFVLDPSTIRQTELDAMVSPVVLSHSLYNKWILLVGPSV